MKKHIYDKLISIAKENGIRYSKHGEPKNENIPTYFWTVGNKTFCDRIFNIDEWRFYKLCLDNKLI